MSKNNLGNKEIMASNIRRYLDNEGMTPKELSRKINVAYTTVLDWANGNSYPRIDKIELMARYFGIDKSDLVEEYKPKSNNTDETIDLKDVLNRTVAFDGHTLDNNDAELIKSLLENMVKNKD